MELSQTPPFPDVVEMQDQFDNTAIPTKKRRTATNAAQDTSPRKRNNHTELSGLDTDLQKIRKPSAKAPSRKQHHVKLSLPHDHHHSQPSPVGGQLQTKMLSAVRGSDGENHIPPQSLDPGTSDDETARALRYFSSPHNRGSQHAIQAFFDALPKQAPTDTTYKHRYQALKRAAWSWARDSFSVVDASVSELPDLMQLATEHPQLMEYINYIAASPSAGTWEELLNSRRAEIVYSILGKVLEVHVFGEEAFGATPSQKRTLRMADREMFDADGKHAFIAPPPPL